MKPFRYRLLLLMFILGCIIPGATSAQGLVGYWPFTGNANDASGNGNNGTVYAATLTYDRFGVANRAYNFNGINAYIQAAHSTLYDFDSTTEFTLSAWVKFCAKQPIVGTDGNGNAVGSGVSPVRPYIVGQGYTAAVGDIETMSACAVNLLSHEDLLAQFRENAKAQALKFDLHKIVPRYEKLYSRFCRMVCEA